MPETSPPAGSRPTATRRLTPLPAHSPTATPTLFGPSAADRPPPAVLDGDGAVDLIIANTGPGQTVVDFDDDPVLRAAARTTGRRYRALPTRLQAARPTALRTPQADLVTLTWPRPQAPAPAPGALALAVAEGLLQPGGHVALLLEPSIPRTYTITWTGAVLAAARDAGLDYLQDVICLHTGPDHGEDAGDGAPPHQQHRMVLILRPQAGRHP